MSDARTTWEKLSADYVRRVEKALSAVDHPRKEEVLGDLRAHLQRRHDELASEERTPARLSLLIEEMGPPEEYAELLAPEGQAREVTITWRGVWRVGRWVLAAACLLLLVVAAVRPDEAITPLVLAEGAVELAVVVALVVRYARTRDPGLLWLAGALVAFPVLHSAFSLVIRRQIDNVVSHSGTVWLWPLTAVKRGTLTIGQAVMVVAFVGNLVRDGLILVALLKLRLAPRAEK